MTSRANPPKRKLSPSKSPGLKAPLLEDVVSRLRNSYPKLVIGTCHSEECDGISAISYRLGKREAMAYLFWKSETTVSNEEIYNSLVEQIKKMRRQD